MPVSTGKLSNSWSELRFPYKECQLKELTADKRRIAFCGLYCGACPKFLQEKCPGCAANEKAAWCKTRLFAMKKMYESCASCREFSELRQCPLLDNFVSRAIGFLLNSSRIACLERIRATSPDQFAQEMAVRKAMTIPRRKRPAKG
jgi:hypothetical protein